ncbi:voltage-dependent calcium channel subunit alpha-2/delta-2-like isoform X1 [Branchiostoma lanceolatum]|uniref:voltage-dependent calcium channel subunit alpha-2/delta-2-like isoform X1 n=1 Tax=Branchiostoma lanceolatum TaxID=7740 RepID=UPI003455D0D5
MLMRPRGGACTCPSQRGSAQFNMAATRLAAAVLLASLTSSSALQHPSLTIVNEWGDRLEEELYNIVRKYSGVEELKNFYRDHSVNLNVVDVDGQVLVQQTAKEIDGLLSKKMKALETVVKAAEDLALNYTYDPNLAIEDVHWYDAKNLADGDPILTYDPQFRKPINRTYSAIHLPTDIWKGDPKIANELKWSDKLDEVFYANTVEDPGLLWQYFGSSKGPFRNYPAFQWESPGTVDLFDVRRRPWYIQGASSAKDMMILIDNSGSVHGLTLTLIKRSVQELLKTLGENDFVNMAWFNTEAHYVSCFDTFVQANVRNKKVLEVAVLEIGDGNMSDFGKGLEFAFRAFDDFNATHTSQGARCNKIIMLFTDGGTERPVEVFEKYNKDREIRIFTYAVGPPAYSTSALKWMACENKGYYVDIPAVGAIRQKTQDYVAVLSRPMVLSEEKQFMWTNIYLDAMGMGMMTTITLPVYNKSEGSQEILGVMGTDITLAQITKFNPNREVGPTGYTFAINPNGYILFHPSLKSQEQTYTSFSEKALLEYRLGYLSEPPNVDFLEVEPDNPSKEDVRKKMIDRDSGAVTIETFVRSQDERYVDLVNRTYIYGPMNSTIFSLGLVLPEYRQKRIEVENIDIPTGRDYLQTQRSALFIAPWQFCDDVLTNASHADFLQDILEKLSGFDFPTECNEPKLKHLLLDTVVTESLAEFWNNKAVDFKSQDLDSCSVTGNACNATCSNARFNSSDGIVATFVSTEGGITRVFPESECQDFEDRRDTWQQTFFRRSLDNDYFIYSVPYNSYHQNWPVNYTIMATSSVTLNDMGGIKPAVVGVKLDPEIILGTMLHITDQCPGGPSCSDVSRSCRDSENLLCVLLDDGGFIVTTNQDEQVGDVGRFFGEVDGHLMRELYNRSVYRREEAYDFQASCKKEQPKVASAGSRVSFVPRLNLADALNLQWWTTNAAWAYLQQNVYGILFSTSSTMAEELGEEGSIDENVSCVRLQHEYYLGPEVQLYWSADCGNCSRTMTARQLRYSNLLLVVADPLCNSCNNTPVIQEPQKTNNPDQCTVTPRYRRGPEKCYDHHKDEDASHCGAAALAAPSLFATSIQLSFLLFIMKLFGAT